MQKNNRFLFGGRLLGKHEQVIMKHFGGLVFRVEVGGTHNLPRPTVLLF